MQPIGCQRSDATFTRVLTEAARQNYRAPYCGALRALFSRGLMTGKRSVFEPISRPRLFKIAHTAQFLESGPLLAWRPITTVAGPWGRPKSSSRGVWPRTRDYRDALLTCGGSEQRLHPHVDMGKKRRPGALGVFHADAKRRLSCQVKRVRSSHSGYKIAAGGRRYRKFAEMYWALALGDEPEPLQPSKTNPT